MDMALDDIIKSNRTHKDQGGGRGRGRGFGGRGRGRDREGFSGGVAKRRFTSQIASSGSHGVVRQRPDYARRRNQPYRGTSDSFDDDTVWEHDLFEEEEEELSDDTFSSANEDSSRSSVAKVHVDNLDYAVSEQDLKDAVESQIGNGSVLRAFIHYDRSGRSKGSGEVVFNSRQAAQSAIRQLNGLELEGKVLQLTLTTSAPSAHRGGGFAQRGSSTTSSSHLRITANLGQSRRDGRGGFSRRPRGSFRTGGRGQARRNNAPVTEADLDAELDQYNDQRST